VKLSRALALQASLLVGAHAAAQTLPATQKEFQAGQSLVDAKKPAEAAERFDAVTKAEPEFAAGWYALGAARRRAGQCALAIPAYRHYAQMLPNEPEPYYGLGLCLKEEGQLASAAQALRRYVDLEKRPSSQKWVDAAKNAIDEIGNGADAREPAATTRPDTNAKPDTTPPASAARGAPEGGLAAGSQAADLYAKAQRLRDSGHIEEAIAAFKEAIAADPKQMVARAALGELLLKIRRDSDAIEAFRGALRVNGEYPLAWYELAFAFRVRGRLPEAVDAYEHYIKLKPADPDPYYGLARSLQKLGKKDAARKAFETYVSLEKRPTEQRWVDAANGEIRALGGAAAAP
jgi:tetratricopeptide (TPR) repeat protein